MLVLFIAILFAVSRVRPYAPLTGLRLRFTFPIRNSTTIFCSIRGPSTSNICNLLLFLMSTSIPSTRSFRIPGFTSHDYLNSQSFTRIVIRLQPKYKESHLLKGTPRLCSTSSPIPFRSVFVCPRRSISIRRQHPPSAFRPLHGIYVALGMQVCSLYGPLSFAPDLFCLRSFRTPYFITAA